MRKQTKKNLKLLILCTVGFWYGRQAGYFRLPQTRAAWGQVIIFEIIGFLLIGLFILWARGSNNRWWANMEATVIPQHLALIEKKRLLEETKNDNS